mmetsp:Transcript_18857/g.21605  ORF Transcript_18857/g.21605 Transcript_18857/m.21605 type:complete len:720 (+) Transcript_18857:102-2261(+)
MENILLFPLKVFLIVLDLAITLVSFGFVNAFKKFSEAAPLRSVPVKDDESHRVDPEYKGKLATTPSENVATLYDLARESFTNNAPRQCMGTREFLRWKSPKVKHFGGIKWKTFEEVGALSHKFGAALRKENVVPAPNTTTLEQIKTSCSIAIFENTCAEWMISALGAFSQSVTVATIYATLGLDAVIGVVNECRISAIVCNKSNVKNLVDRIKDMKTLKTIIYTNDLIGQEDKTELPVAPRGVKIVEFYEFCSNGNTTAFPPTPPKADTCAVIMYTSGSTGKPKGVVIKHRAVVSAVASGKIALGIKSEDVYLGYLPLAHIMEMMAEFVMVSLGATICYADPKSLTTTGAYPIGALEQYSPTMMVAVPKIWDVIKKGIEAKVAASSPVARFLVKTAFEARMFALKHGYDTPLFKALVFKKFSKVVGGRLRFALSGGGPLNAEVQNFIRACFGCSFAQGYGLTETCASLTIQRVDDLRPMVVGIPVPSVEAKLESTPDVCDKTGLPYMTTDRIDHEGNAVFGRGEILCKGACVSTGYYMMPEETKKVFRDDGWFETGDIGQFMADGSMRIVDRKKNLVKLKGGEYVALERMEMIYGNTSFVDAVNGGICCYGDGDMDRPIALIQISQPFSMKWAKEKGITGDFDEVKKSKELHDAVMSALMVEHKKGGLSNLEKLKGLCFLTEPWTPENGCLTAANKLQRRTVITMFEKEFNEVKKKGIF